MDKLDHLVADHIGARLLQPKRLETVLASVIDRRQERTERRREHLAELHRRITETEQRLDRLFDAIESGLVFLKALRDQATADAERTQLALDSSGNQAISPTCSRGSPVRSANGYGSMMAATAAIICALWRSTSRSRTTRFVSWDRSQNRCKRSRPLPAEVGSVRHL